MRVIYLDVLIGINLAMDYLLLFGASRLSNIYCKRIRLFFAAALGACYAAVSCVTEWWFINIIPIKLLISCLMVLIAFGKRSIKQLARLIIIFLGISFAVAGGVLALGNVSNTSFFAGGGYYIDIPFRTVIGVIFISWVITGYIFRGSASDKVNPREVMDITLYFQGKTAIFKLLVDTGNTLHDPISGKPVLILDRYSAAKIFNPSAAAVLAGLNHDNAPDILSEMPENLKNRFRLIPFHAVGNSGGLLLAFKPDNAVIDGKTWEGIAAINSNRISGGQYEGLIGL